MFTVEPVAPYQSLESSSERVERRYTQTIVGYTPRSLLPYADTIEVRFEGPKLIQVTFGHYTVLAEAVHRVLEILEARKKEF